MNILNNNYKLYINMKNSKFLIDKFAKLIEQGLITSKDLTAELFNILKSKRDEFIFKMKLTSKEEFEVLAKRVENLEVEIKKSKKKKERKIKRAKKS
tara:strand:+ start:957 stop:1247 length:291 start_codon:yes stop_codon:yes gene_type:complete